MKNSFIYNEKINELDVLFLYCENILPNNLFFILQKWLQNKKFKDGYSIEGKEIPRKQIWYHKNMYC